MLLVATGATNVDVTADKPTVFRDCFIDPYQGRMAALFVGILGTAFMTGSVFAVVAEPPIIWLTILLAVPFPTLLNVIPNGSATPL